MAVTYWMAENHLWDAASETDQETSPGLSRKLPEKLPVRVAIELTGKSGGAWGIPQHFFKIWLKHELQ